MPVFPKNVIFVIDRSGSMAGRKIEQVTNFRILTSACISHTHQPFEEVTVNFTFKTRAGFVTAKFADIQKFLKICMWRFKLSKSNFFLIWLFSWVSNFKAESTFSVSNFAEYFAYDFFLE